ncbi:MAG: hypothetical protein O7G87_22960 [bacterium]|nr:hypothetical protein [bacterium]
MSQAWRDPGPSEGVKASTMQALVLALGVVTLPMLLGTFGMGYAAHYGYHVEVATHVKVGLVTVILTILTHTTTMFYFMGTGSAIKEEVKERNLDPEFLRRARAFKGRFFYMLFFGICLVMVAGMIGGGAHAALLIPGLEGGRSILSYLHEGLAILTLVVNLIALAMTPFNIVANNRLLDDVGATRGQEEGTDE